MYVTVCHDTSPDVSSAGVIALARYASELAASGYSPETIRVKVSLIRAIVVAAGVGSLELTRAHVDAYLTGRVLAPWSRRKYVSHLRGFARWAGIPDPTAHLPAVRVPSAVPRPVSEDALAAMLGAARGRERPFVLLGAYAGLRSFETAKVRGDDLEDGPHGAVLRVVGKGGRTDVVPVPAILSRELRWWRARQGDGRLWVVGAPTVRESVKRVAERAGVPDVTSHRLRHRYGTAIYGASGDLLVTQKLMRHSSPATTAGYAAVADRRAAELVRQLPGAGTR